MTAIGIRVFSNSKIYYAIYQSAGDTLTHIDASVIVVPLSISIPDRLSYIRNTFLDLITEYSIDSALIRAAELSGFRPSAASIERHYIEGVISEGIANSTVSNYLLCKMSTICRLLNINQKEFKALINDEKQYENVPDQISWGDLTKECRESILSCHAALNYNRNE